MRIATSRNSTSRNGTRASTPQAIIDLLARRQSYWCSASSLRTVSSRSEEHTSELQSLMRTSYAVFCLKKKTEPNNSCCTHNVSMTDTFLLLCRSHSYQTPTPHI